jgi:hypothetical protein
VPYSQDSHSLRVRSSKIKQILLVVPTVPASPFSSRRDLGTHMYQFDCLGIILHLTAYQGLIRCPVGNTHPDKTRNDQFNLSFSLWLRFSGKGLKIRAGETLCGSELGIWAFSITRVIYWHRIMDRDGQRVSVADTRYPLADIRQGIRIRLRMCPFPCNLRRYILKDTPPYRRPRPRLYCAG